MLKFVICDDDIHMLDRISSLLEKVIVANDFDAKVVYKTTDFKELLSYISENKIDVVILDIEFYGKSENGLDVAEAHTCEDSLEDYFKRVTGGEGIA